MDPLLGSYNKTFRVVSVYRPVECTGCNSTYCQKVNYSMKLKKSMCSRELLLIDLGENILKWKVEGGSIVVMGGRHQYIRTEK